ncbi:DUF2190 family protein [Sodalis sp. RH21]|uniref:DUF2190 family protein n=1 Tax=unclassified Sodalis (in: enterobacteria) TaxID=2636512 RepID=UPI0039B37B9D
MAKNYVQDGKTITITALSDIASGDVVVVGGIVAVAITDIAEGETGDGFAEGVFKLPKLTADVIATGSRVHFKDDVLQLDATDAIAAGVAWETAGAGVTSIAVKING